jgi:hypothetical protein
VRPPARADWRSREIAWRELEPHAAAGLSSLLARYPGDFEAAYPQPGAPPAYLRHFKAGHGVPSCFIKLIPDVERLHEQEVASLARLLAAQQVLTPTLRDQVAVADGRTAFVYEWLEGSMPCGTQAELAGIGAALAGFHRALAGQDMRDRCRERTEGRLRELLSLAGSERFERYWAGSTAHDFACRMSRAFITGFDALREGAQPCHGDLNAGNLLRLEDARIAFLDLEDALHSNLWPGLDLAKLIERLVLVRAEQDDCSQRVGQAAATLVDAYLDAGGARSVAPDEAGRGRLAMAMRWHIGLAVLVLTLRVDRESPICLAEIAKFEEIESWVSACEASL